MFTVREGPLNFSSTCSYVICLPFHAICMAQVIMVYTLCLAATKQLYEWFSSSVCLSVCPSHLFVKLKELHIATARKPLIHQNQPVAQYLQKIQPCML